MRLHESRRAPRRRLYAVVLLIPLTVAACSSSKSGGSTSGGGSGSAATTAGALKVYSSQADLEAAAKAEGGNLDIYLAPELNNLNTDFVKAYPFAKVKQTSLEPSAAAAKWNTEVSAGVTDVDALMTYVTNVPAFASKGHVAMVQVPNDSLIGQAQQDPKHYFHDIVNVPSALLYNTKLLPKGGPPDLKNLTDPEWKGKLIMDNPSAGGPSGLAMAAMKGEIGAAGWEQYLKDLEANQPDLTDSSSSSYDALVRGERPLCICSYHDYVSQAAGTPVKADLENQSTTGLIEQGNAVVIASKAAHPAMAALWVNWLLSPTGGQALVAASGRTPTVAGVAGAEKVNVPAGIKVASFSALGDYLDDPTPYNDTFKKIFGS